MIRALLWKEAREQRIAAIVLIALALMAIAVVLPMLELVGGVHSVRVVLAAFFAWACGMVTGAILLANERESGTQPLLDILPKWRAQLFFGKLLFGAIVTFLQVVALIAACELLRGRQENDPSAFFTLCFIAFGGFLG